MQAMPESAAENPSSLVSAPPSSRWALEGFSRRRAWMMTLALIAEGLLLSALRMEEKIPPTPRLEDISAHVGSWKLVGEETLDAATQALLRPDASLNRAYEGPQGGVSLYVGYFKTTQANHPAPHSPSVCLPGAGWKEVYLKQQELDLGGGRTLAHNEYLLEKAGQRMMVLYWFQNSRRSWSAEVLSKLYMFPDYWRLRRTDISIVRVIVPIRRGQEEAALSRGRDFALAIYPQIEKTLALPVS